jgi:hypothetical protein
VGHVRDGSESTKFLPGQVVKITRVAGAGTTGTLTLFEKIAIDAFHRAAIALALPVVASSPAREFFPMRKSEDKPLPKPLPGEAAPDTAIRFQFPAPAAKADVAGQLPPLHRAFRATVADARPVANTDAPDDLGFF